MDTCGTEFAIGGASGERGVMGRLGNGTCCKGICGVCCCSCAVAGSVCNASGDDCGAAGEDWDTSNERAGSKYSGCGAKGDSCEVTGESCCSAGAKLTCGDNSEIGVEALVLLIVETTNSADFHTRRASHVVMAPCCIVNLATTSHLPKRLPATAQCRPAVEGVFRLLRGLPELLRRTPMGAQSRMDYRRPCHAVGARKCFH